MRGLRSGREIPDAEARRDLEAIIHPEVARLRATELAAARAAGVAIVVSDVPLLYETGMEKEFAVIVLVHAPAGWFVVGLGRNGAEYSVLLIACLLCVGLQHVGSRRVP